MWTMTSLIDRDQLPFTIAMTQYVYPMFEQASKRTLVPEWAEMLHSCALGHFPKNVKYNDKQHELYVTIVKKKKIEKKLVILPKDIGALMTAMINVFINDLNLRSVADEQIQMEKFKAVKTEAEDDTNANTYLDSLIIDYLMSIYPQEHISRLYSCIKFALYVGVLTDENILIKSSTETQASSQASKKRQKSQRRQSLKKAKENAPPSEVDDEDDDADSDVDKEVEEIDETEEEAQVSLDERVVEITGMTVDDSFQVTFDKDYPETLDSALSSKNLIDKFANLFKNLSK